MASAIALIDDLEYASSWLPFPFFKQNKTKKRISFGITKLRRKDYCQKCMRGFRHSKHMAVFSSDRGSERYPHYQRQVIMVKSTSQTSLAHCQIDSIKNLVTPQLCGWQRVRLPTMTTIRPNLKQEPSKSRRAPTAVTLSGPFIVQISLHNMISAPILTASTGSCIIYEMRPAEREERNTLRFEWTCGFSRSFSHFVSVTAACLTPYSHPYSHLRFETLA